MKRNTFFLLFMAFIACNLIQGCFSFRMSERTSLRKFNKAGVAARSVMVEEGNQRIHYTITGSDTLPTLVFLHGSPGGSREYFSYLKNERLLQRFRLVAIDRPGFGLSNYGISFPLQVQSRLLGPVLYELQNGKPFFVAGHSLGGPVAAALAANYPQLITGLIVMSGALDPDLEKKENWRPFVNHEPIRSLLPGAFPQSNMELWYLKTDLRLLAPQLNRITCHVYILHGATDKMVPPGNVDYMKRTLVNARSIHITMMPHTGHLLHVTRVKKVVDFLLQVK